MTARRQQPVAWLPPSGMLGRRAARAGPAWRVRQVPRKPNSAESRRVNTVAMALHRPAPARKRIARAHSCQLQASSAVYGSSPAGGPLVRLFFSTGPAPARSDSPLRQSDACACGFSTSARVHPGSALCITRATHCRWGTGTPTEPAASARRRRSAVRWSAVAEAQAAVHGPALDTSARE